MTLTEEVVTRIAETIFFFIFIDTVIVMMTYVVVFFNYHSLLAM